MRGLTIVDLAYNPETEIISFTACVHDGSGTTTVASFTTANRAKAGAREAQRLVEQRVTELIVRKAPSGRVYQQGR